MDHLCTYCDIHFLARALALYASLVRHWPDFELTILCLDDTTFELLRRMALPRVHLVALAELERYDPALPAVRGTRSRLGYYLTTTPLLPRYVLDHAPDASSVFYLDADLYFFSHPGPVHAELGHGSILVHEHSAAMVGHPHGTFNVGLVGFQRDEQGLACLALWRERCLGWCDEWEGPGGAFGDQAYLDEWASRFSRFVVARGRGIGFAPWNLAERKLTREPDGRWLVDGDPLVFFHFHGLRGIGPAGLATALASFDTRIAPEVSSVIYRPYVRAVHDAARRARDLGAPHIAAFPRGIRSGSGGADSRLGRIARQVRVLPGLGRRALEGRLMVIVGDHVFSGGVRSRP